MNPKNVHDHFENTYITVLYVFWTLVSFFQNFTHKSQNWTQKMQITFSCKWNYKAIHKISLFWSINLSCICSYGVTMLFKGQSEKVVTTDWIYKHTNTLQYYNISQSFLFTSPQHCGLRRCTWTGHLLYFHC